MCVTPPGARPRQRDCCTSLATGLLLLDVMDVPYQLTPIRQLQHNNASDNCFSRASILFFFAPRLAEAPHGPGPPDNIPHTIGNRGLYGRTLEGPTAHSETWNRSLTPERPVEALARLVPSPTTEDSEALNGHIYQVALPIMLYHSATNILIARFAGIR
jgi:hypothetical protein